MIWRSARHWVPFVRSSSERSHRFKVRIVSNIPSHRKSLQFNQYIVSFFSTPRANICRRLLLRHWANQWPLRSPRSRLSVSLTLSYKTGSSKVIIVSSLRHDTKVVESAAATRMLCWNPLDTLPGQKREQKKVSNHKRVHSDDRSH
jgi:hypothetical protein